MAANAKPKILYDSILDGATLTATDTASGYSVQHVTDLRPYTLHKFNAAGTKYITADCGAAVSADALALVGHNLHTASATVSVETSPNNSDWTERLAGFQPASDRALLKEFTTQSFRYWRIKIVTASVQAQVGVALLGEIFDFERWPLNRFDPDAQKVIADATVSKAGNLLGVTRRYASRSLALSLKSLTPSWVENTFLPAWEAHLGELKPFVFAWDITNHATEVCFVRIPANFSLNLPYDPTRRSLSLKFEGVAE